MKSYNVLLITTDQEQSFVDLPAKLALKGHERLRERSVAFRKFQVNTTPCGPSRSVIYTGQQTQFTGMFTNPNVPPHPEVPRNMPTLGSMLRSLGYSTAYKGKWHLSNLNHGIDFHAARFPDTSAALEDWGFSDYNFDGDHHGIVWDGFKHDAAIAADAANWLQGKNGSKEDGKPWFLAVNFINPHDIMFYDATGTMKAERADPIRVAPLLPAPASPIYDEWLDLDLPESFSDDLSSKPDAHSDDQKLADLMYGFLPKTNEQGWLNHRNYYYNCIRDMDRNICTVLDALERTGEADRTIVIFTSDHGEMAGAHGMRQKGASMYKEVVGVSLFVSHPDQRRPVETDALATSIDIAPTLLDMLGVNKGEVEARWPALKGVSLVSALEGGTSERDKRGSLLDYTTTLAWDVNIIEPLFKGQARGNFTAEEMAILQKGVSLDEYACYRGINDGRYKFARYFKPSEHHTPKDWATLIAHNQLELYDTETDPNEIENLAATPETHRDLILDLNARLNALVETEIGVDDGSCYPGPANYKLAAD